jgi:hypothetical protein
MVAGAPRAPETIVKAPAPKPASTKLPASIVREPIKTKPDTSAAAPITVKTASRSRIAKAAPANRLIETSTVATLAPPQTVTKTAVKTLQSKPVKPATIATPAKPPAAVKVPKPLQAPAPPTAPAPTMPPVKRIDNIRRTSGPQTPKPPKTTTRPTQIPTTTNAGGVTPTETAPTSKNLRIRSIAAAAFKRAVTPRFHSHALLAAVTLTLPLLALELLGYLRPMLSLIITPATSMPPVQSTPVLLVVALSGCIIGYLLAHPWLNALSYGFAKLNDNRNVAPSLWRQAGLNSTWQAVWLDLTILAWIGIIILATIGLVDLAALFIYNPLALQLIAIGAWSVAGYLAVGLMLTRRLSGSILVLSGKGPFNSLDLGWHLWRRQPVRLFGAGLLNLLVNLSTILAIFGLLWVLSTLPQISSVPQIVRMAAGSALGLLVAAALLAFNRSYWMGVASRMVRTYYPQHTAELLSGRSLHSNLKTACFLALAVLVLGAVCYYFIASDGPSKLPRIFTGPLI